MKSVAVFSLLAFAAMAHAAVDGTVTNGTSGKPQPGATVTLFQPTSQGPQFIDSVKTDAAGKFSITKEIPNAGGGPLLLQATYAGVQYNKMLTPGTPTTGVNIPVYESSKQPGDAKIRLHAMLIEPNNGTMSVAESYQFENNGTTAWNNPDTGTLQFALPAAAQGKVTVNVLAPGGLPIRRAADPAGKPNTFKVDFPIKPGTSEIRLEWSMPFTSPGVFEGENLVKGAPSMKIVAPAGVTLKGDGVTALGPEPEMPGTMIYDVANAAYHIDVEGTGSLSTGSGQGQDDGAPRVTENMPKLYGLVVAKGELLSTLLSVKWVLLSVLGMLAVGFAMLYRKGNPAAPTAASGAKHERDLG
ncbi:MAG TPA: carboxypeptidase-like regulatory domain-containing protein [Bryobacteraceae bacterium]|nr:carboxypeptidase-like regulatory domain-containing protein [Bryobacteraceae bacterium]